MTLPVEPMPRRQLPFEPLKRIVEGRLLRLTGDRVSARSGLHALLGETDARYFYNAYRWGHVSDVIADRICVTRLKLHPAEVWGAAWFELAPPQRTRGPKPKSPPPIKEQRISIHEAARVFDVPISAVRSWIATGAVPFITRSGQRFFRRVDLEPLAAADSFLSGMTFSGEALKAARERAGYTQTQLAFFIGVVPSHVCKIEAGRSPTTPVARLITEKLGISLQEALVAKR